MQFNKAVILSTLGLICGSASAQSFNVDIDALSGNPGAGVPPSTYGAEANQAGTWNSISPASVTTSTLKNLNGTNSAATFTRATNGSFSGGNLMIFDFAFLYNDWQQIAVGAGDMVYSFNNLQAGDYLLYTYAHNTGTGGVGKYTDVEVVSAGGPDVIQCGGFLSANSFSEFGISHIIHSKTVSAGGSITVKIRATTTPGVVNGFQLVKLPAGGGFPVRKYVDDSAATSFYSGDSWTEPYAYVNDALLFASMVGGQNCEIWVAQGFYYPTKYQSSTDRTASFVIPSGVKFYGGFNGTETTLAERTSPAFNITALSGSINSALQTDNSYNVVVADGCSSSTVIDGFSIVRGRASGSGADQDHGGGLRIIAGSPQIRNCKFLSNEASLEGAGVYVGGAFGIPSFTNCLFYNNDCYNGVGGGFASATGGNIRFVNCEFDGNNAVGNGGGADMDGPGEFYNCLFSGNTTGSSLSYGGAIYAHGGDFADVYVKNTTISHNFCAGLCGGVAGRNGADLIIANSIIWGNTDPIVNNTTNENQYNDLNNGSTVAMTSTTLQGLAGVNGQDPKFVDFDGANNVVGDSDDDCHLQLSSPCIDAGDNGNIPADVTDIDGDSNSVEAVPVDLDNNARRINIASVVDTGIGGSPVVDRGAYETPVPPCLGDFNGDGQRNTIDLTLLLGKFGQSVTPGSTGDMNGDGTVNTLDLTSFLGVFGQNCP